MGSIGLALLSSDGRGLQKPRAKLEPGYVVDGRSTAIGVEEISRSEQDSMRWVTGPAVGCADDLPKNFVQARMVVQI